MARRSTHISPEHRGSPRRYLCEGILLSCNRFKEDLHAEETHDYDGHHRPDDRSALPREGTPPSSAGRDAAGATSRPTAPATAPAAASRLQPTDDAASASSAKFVNSQQQDQFLASKFKGTDVIGADDEKIGDVSDILFDKDGKIEAYVVGVGGFLGIGAKDVALAPSAFQVVAGRQVQERVRQAALSMTKDQLKQAANFEPYKAPSATTGMGAPALARPARRRRPAPAGAPK